VPTTANDQQATERRRERKGPTTKIGNLTKDPELRFGANGTAYANFTLAEERPKEAGNWTGERVTEYYDVVCFRDLAEHVAESLSKGARAIVQGNAELEHWTGRDGQERTSKRIVADHVGAELRFVTAQIQKVTHLPRSKASETDKGYVDDDEPF
jgi:single-strand DNA-binding protein